MVITFDAISQKPFTQHAHPSTPRPSSVRSFFRVGRPGSRSSGRVASGLYGIYSNALARLSCARPHFYYSPLSFSLFVLFPLPFKPYNDLTRRNRSDIVQPFKSLCIWIKNAPRYFLFHCNVFGTVRRNRIFSKTCKPYYLQTLEKICLLCPLIFCRFGINSDHKTTKLQIHAIPEY